MKPIDKLIQRLKDAHARQGHADARALRRGHVVAHILHALLQFGFARPVDALEIRSSLDAAVGNQPDRAIRPHVLQRRPQGFYNHRVLSDHAAHFQVILRKHGTGSFRLRVPLGRIAGGGERASRGAAQQARDMLVID